MSWGESAALGRDCGMGDPASLPLGTMLAPVCRAAHPPCQRSDPVPQGQATLAGPFPTASPDPPLPADPPQL